MAPKKDDILSWFTGNKSGLIGGGPQSGDMFSTLINFFIDLMGKSLENIGLAKDPKSDIASNALLSPNIAAKAPISSAADRPFTGQGRIFDAGGIFQNFVVRSDDTTGEKKDVGRYGNQRHKPHPALDISENMGARAAREKTQGNDHFGIKAAADGKVVFAGVKTGFGNTVITRYGSGASAVYTLNAHMSQFNVKTGDVISASTVLGQSGKTGNAHGTVEHVHFETWIRGADGNLYAVDASKYSLNDLSSNQAVRQQAIGEAIKSGSGFTMRADGTGRLLKGWNLVNQFERNESPGQVVSTETPGKTRKLEEAKNTLVTGFNQAAPDISKPVVPLVTPTPAVGVHKVT